MKVQLTTHNNRIALRILSGYRTGNLMGEPDGYIVHFSTEQAAVE